MRYYKFAAVPNVENIFKNFNVGVNFALLFALLSAHPPRFCFLCLNLVQNMCYHTLQVCLPPGYNRTRTISIQTALRWLLYGQMYIYNEWYVMEKDCHQAYSGVPTDKFIGFPSIKRCARLGWS